MHEHVSQNLNGRDFVVGDIHGAYGLLIEELRRVGFNRENDRLFSVGDLIDRGPDSEKCLTLLDEPWFYLVRGNHEQMLIDAVKNGEGYDWWNSYGSWTKWILPEKVESWAKQLALLPISMTLQCEEFAVGICHAETDGQNWKASRENPRSENAMLWGRRILRGNIDYNVEGVDITIHGHTPLDSPRWVGNRYFLDTGAWETGILTLRKVADLFSEYNSVSSVFGR
ncbi:metallophosphoesterase [Hellea balneolensis]|uniref:metallophosphoesterase n=1 Tax=Hellea balneolensis TaxID=287478 RepID=UPI0006864C4A|nr:metallophosphoesterase [Hellea balneolensis]